MINWRKEFDKFLLDNDSFEDVVRALRDNKASLRAYLNKYTREPSKVIYHMPINWGEQGDPNYWKVLDRKWWKYCQENELE